MSITDRLGRSASLGICFLSGGAYAAVQILSPTAHVNHAPAGGSYATSGIAVTTTASISMASDFTVAVSNPLGEHQVVAAQSTLWDFTDAVSRTVFPGASYS
jgi:hypothetical protein